MTSRCTTLWIEQVANILITCGLKLPNLDFVRTFVTLSTISMLWEYVSARMPERWNMIGTLSLLLLSALVLHCWWLARGTRSWILLTLATVTLLLV